jgi:hypothetical protein
MKKFILTLVGFFGFLSLTAYSQDPPSSFSIASNGEGWGWHYAVGTYEQYDMDAEAKQRLAEFNYPLVEGSPVYKIVTPVPPLDESYALVYVYAVHTEYGWMLVDDEHGPDDPPFLNPPRGDQQMSMIDGVPSFDAGYGFTVQVLNYSSNGAFLRESEELNKGLIFEDGQWEPEP